MELRQLQYLVAVVEEASFTRAASRVHVAQPGVSAQVRRLERELGEELLDRTGRAVRPTAAGEAVLPYARAALAAVDGARAAVDELAGLVRGRVTVGTVVGCGAVGLPEVLAGFHRAHRGVELTLSEGNSDQLLAELSAGRLDLALVGLAEPAGPGIEVQIVVDEELVLGVGPDDVWADSDVVPVGRPQRGSDLSPVARGVRRECGQRGHLPHEQPAVGQAAGVAHDRPEHRPPGRPGRVHQRCGRGHRGRRVGQQERPPRLRVGANQVDHQQRRPLAPAQAAEKRL